MNTSSMMNYDVNRNNAEVVVSIDATNPHNFRKDTEAQMDFGPDAFVISNFHLVCGSKSKNQFIVASSGKDLKQAGVAKIEVLFMPHNSGTMLNMTTANGDTIYFSDLRNERVSDFLLVGWFFSQEAERLFTVVLIGENQRHPQLGVFDCSDVEDNYLVDFIDDLMTSCQT